MRSDETADPEQGLTTTNVPDEATLRSLVDQLPLTVYVDRLDEVSSNVYTTAAAVISVAG